MPDVQSDWLAVEVKYRQKMPKWIEDAMRQACFGASPNQLPIVVVHKEGERRRKDLVIMRLGDFLDWFGGGVVCGTTGSDEKSTPV